MHVRKVPQDNFTLWNIEYQKLNPKIKRKSNKVKFSYQREALVQQP